MSSSDLHQLQQPASPQPHQLHHQIEQEHNQPNQQLEQHQEPEQQQQQHQPHSSNSRPTSRPCSRPASPTVGQQNNEDRQGDEKANSRSQSKRPRPENPMLHSRRTSSSNSIGQSIQRLLQPAFLNYNKLPMDEHQDVGRLQGLASIDSLPVAATTTTGSSPLPVNTTQTTKASSPNHRQQHSQSHHAQQKGTLLYRFWHSETGRLICAAVFFIVVCIGMAFTNQFSDHRWVTTDYTTIFLRDRLFDIFPEMTSITPANVFVMTSVIFTIVGMGLICPTWTTRAIVIRRVLWVVGVLSVCRALTLSVTTLPTPKKECKPTLDSSFGAMFWVALQMIPGTVEACTDDIFSGHSVFMVTCAIQWRLYCKNKWVTWFAYAYITAGLYFVIATRLHYTVDVVLAIFMTYFTWSLYVGTVDIVMEKEYFGVDRHHEKYKVFDGQLEDYEENIETEQDNELANSSNVNHKGSFLNNKRAQLQYRMNRMRGPGIGYRRGEYDRVAFLPMQYNVWLIGAVRWMDGLDLRMRKHGNGSREQSRWNQLVIEHRARGGSSSDITAGKVEVDNMLIEERRDASYPVALEGIHIDGGVPTSNNNTVLQRAGTPISRTGSYHQEKTADQ